MLAVRAVAVMGVAVVLSACGSPATLRTADIERILVDGFSTQVGGRFSASCPEPILAQQGLATTCTVTDLDAGTQVSVEVVQDDDEGAFHWKAVSVTGSGTPGPAVS